MVAWKSSTGVAERTQRSSVAGPTMVVSVGNGGVWKATPSAAGTGVQSQAGLAAHALPPGARLVAGLAAGSRVKLDVGVCWRDRPERSKRSPAEVVGS